MTLSQFPSLKMITDQELFHYSLIIFFLISPATVVALRYATAPYGKHRRSGWGPTMSTPLAWFLMESPTLWLTTLVFPLGQNRTNPKALVLGSLYLTHYFHRTVLYPIRLHLRSSSRKTPNEFPVSMALMAFVFNILNAYLQIRWVTHYAVYHEENNNKWLWWRFFTGLAIFVVGMAVNVTSDYALMELKSEGGGGYKVPRGGLFELVSCPNYFGEILEWFGWFVVNWSWPALGFFLFTCANLIPRGVSNHKWYLEKFAEDYPKNRKAVIPFVF